MVARVASLGKSTMMRQSRARFVTLAMRAAVNRSSLIGPVASGILNYSSSR